MYGPRTADSTMSAVAAAAYRASRLAGRSSSPPATIGRTRAEGAHQSGVAMVPQAMAGTARSSRARASRSEPSPRK